MDKDKTNLLIISFACAAVLPPLVYDDIALHFRSSPTPHTQTKEPKFCEGVSDAFLKMHEKNHGPLDKTKDCPFVPLKHHNILDRAFR
ncbi:MAG: hypothetical protein CL561_05555 [Alphaproteobacteria bacterium]|nr:hypothetical protein [Alphaproteobacteria bacterium]